MLACQTVISEITEGSQWEIYIQGSEWEEEYSQEEKEEMQKRKILLLTGGRLELDPLKNDFSK